MRALAVLVVALLFVAVAHAESFEAFNVTEVEGTCGGNCPGGRCPSCPCGTARRSVNIAAICSKYGWNQKCCQCIVSHESGGNANAMNYNSNGSFDVGVFQVNNVNWASCSGGKPPCDPDTNFGCAVKVWQWGNRSFKLWSTCRACGCC